MHQSTPTRQIAALALATLLLLTLAASSVVAADRDKDGLQDWFERKHGVTSPDRKDSDWDGVIDSAEDNDGDRLGNLGEQRFRTSPGRRDTDGDGTADGNEDRDGDGRSNAREQDQRPVPAGLRPSLAAAATDFSGVTRGCDSRKGSSALRRCWFGKAGSNTRIVLMGDSHAMMLVDPIARVASAEGWRLVTMLKGGCSPVFGTMNAGQMEGDGGRSCRNWRGRAVSAIEDKPPDLFIITASESYKLVDASGRVIPKAKRPPLWNAGMDRMIERMPAKTRVLVLGDVPNNSEHPVRCLQANPGDMSRCVTRREPLSERRVEVALRAAVADHDQHFATLYHKICSYDPCPLVQGRTMMWRDRSHLTGTFARHLTPALRTILRDVMSAPATSRRAPGAAR